MLSEEYKNLRTLLLKHEGLRLKPYKCSAGKTTIGVGRNLDDVGITEEEAMILLNRDIQRVVKEALIFPWFKSINIARQDVVLSMIFNLGFVRFAGFKKMIEAIRVGNFVKASEEMLDSEWAKQVGRRALELADMMRTGIYPRS